MRKLLLVLAIIPAFSFSAELPRYQLSQSPVNGDTLVIDTATGKVWMLAKTGESVHFVPLAYFDATSLKETHTPISQGSSK